MYIRQGYPDLDGVFNEKMSVVTFSVMRAPELYPPSPRVTPAHSRYGTPAPTPKFGHLHGTPGASRMSIATTMSSNRHSQVNITGSEIYFPAFFSCL